VPKAANAACKSIAAGKGITATFDVSKTSMINWKATVSDYDATAVTVKRLLNTNTIGFKASSEYNLPIASSTTQIVFKNLSSNNYQTVSQICVDMN
jgi:hypothetical protein